MISISKKMFSRIIRGAVIIYGNNSGVVYRCCDGRVAMEYHDGEGWNYVIVGGGE